MKPLTTTAIIAIHDRVVERYGGTLGVYNRGLLESALEQASRHGSLARQAAVLGALIYRTRPFREHNERVGLVVIDETLRQNDDRRPARRGAACLCSRAKTAESAESAEARAGGAARGEVDFPWAPVSESCRMSTRQKFDAAYRAHRAWTTRRIPYAEYDAATRLSMPAAHAEEAHKARTWKHDAPARLSWKRDSAGRLEAYLGGGSEVTVMPAPAWAGSGFVAVLDRLGIGQAPRYIDASGSADYGTARGRSVLFTSEAQAKAGASRFLIRLRGSWGKSVGAQVRALERKNPLGSWFVTHAGPPISNPAKRNPKLPAGWKVQMEGRDKVVAYKNGHLMAWRWRDDGWVGMLPPSYALPPRSVMIEGNALLKERI